MSKPLRTQYPFDTTGLKYVSMSDIMRFQRQWETFEKVENYNDIIYQKLQAGNRTQLYYQFSTSEELNDYRNGQLLHVKKYPTVSFASISDRKMPNIVYDSPPPYITLPIKQNATFQVSKPASEKTEEVNDLAIYVHASTYNIQHTYKYNFPSNEEKLAYDRAEQRVFAAQSMGT